jgi:hypothetical protein
MGEWLPLYGHRTLASGKECCIKFDDYDIIYRDSREEPIQIRSRLVGRVIKCSTIGYYSLKYGEMRGFFGKNHLALASAFPQLLNDDTIDRFTVDHINDDPTDGRIQNLQWMSRSDNSRKGQKKSVESAKAAGGKRGRAIIMKRPDADTPRDPERAIEIGRFRSGGLAANYLLDHVIQTQPRPKHKTVASKITRASSSHLKAYGYYFGLVPEDIADMEEEEEWRPYPNSSEYQVSSPCKISKGV